jgi:hypothetical protein
MWDQVACRALTAKRCLEIRYDGYSRIVEVHACGLAKEGHQVTTEPSSAPRPRSAHGDSATRRWRRSAVRFRAAVLWALLAIALAAPAWARDTTPPVPPGATQPDEAELATHGHYVNKSGALVHSPAKTVDGKVPSGASAQCRDGTYSFSQHHRGACSHHGGVGSWLN